MQSPQWPATSRPTTVYLGLGSNLGDRRAFIDAAVAALVGRGVLREARVSPLYETDAVGSDAQPPYVNGVVRGETALSAEALLAACLEVEASLGRERPPGREKAARTIDIDVLLYGDAVIDSPGLQVPHPRLLDRPFALIPLADIAESGLEHPQTGASLTDFCGRIAGVAGGGPIAGVRLLPPVGLYPPPTRG